MVEQNADLKNEKLEEHLLLDGEKRVVKEEDSGLEKIASLNQEQVGFRTDVIAMITDENQSKKESTVSSKLNTIELGDVDDNSRKNETGSFFPGTESSEKQKQVGGEFLNKTIVNIENSNTEVEAKNSKFKLIEKKMAALEGITQTKEPEQILEILQEIRTIIQTEPRDPDLEPSLLDILKLKEQQLKQKFDLSKECTQETEKKSVTDNDSEVLINQVDHMETDNVLSQLSQVIEAKTT